MGHSSIRIKVRRRKVAALAAYSRQFSVRNNKKGISEKVEHTLYYGDLSNAITNPFTGHKFVPTNPHPIPIDRGNATITGYEWVEPEGMLWKPERHKQPMVMIRYKKRKYSNWKSYSPQGDDIKKIKREKRNDFQKFFQDHTIKPMSKETYWEKLVGHKLQKWEKKNPKPNQDLFDKVEDWEQRRFVAEQRFRDFVVSIYDKLPIMGNRVDSKDKRMKAVQIGEVKDVDGKGHNVHYPNLQVNDKLYINAKNKAQEVINSNPSIIDADLMNHKRNQKRPLDVKRNTKLKKAA